MSAQKDIYGKALKHLLTHTTQYVLREQKQMASTVMILEKATREQLINSYGEANAWRGLACDDFQKMFDLLAAFDLEL